MVNSLLLLLLSSGAGLQDPTTPLPVAPVATETSAKAPAAQPGLQLQAIFTGGPKGSSAIINGHHYHLGQTVAGYRLARIAPDHILLQGQGKPMTLTLFPSLSSLNQS